MNIDFLRRIAFRPRRSRHVCCALVMALGVVAAGAEDDSFARVGVKVVWDLDQADWAAMENRVMDAALGDFAGRSTNFEVLYANPELPAAGQPSGEAPKAWTAVAYDYSAEQGWRLTISPEGEVLSRAPYVQERFANQPTPSEAEFANAVEYLKADPVLGPGLSDGTYAIYEAMPPVEYAVGAPRTLHVGLRPLQNPDDHEIVGVVMSTGEVKRYATKAPEASRAERGSCGPPNGGTCSNPPSSGLAHIAWPADNPVWELDVVRPASTNTSATQNGAGVELRNVHYKGELVLLSANIPVLNVFYTGNACGPYRDWLWQESCFDVSGGEQSPNGFYTSQNASATICVDGTDAGNFRGVGIQTTPDALILVSEMAAGWYRYLNGWKLYSNGDIKADFFYAGTFDSCTCNERRHHAYWRFDWAIEAVEDAGVPGGWRSDNKGQRFSAPSASGEWVDIDTEQTYLRGNRFSAALPEFRVINPTTGTGYELVASRQDSSSLGDANGVSDVWFLKWKSSETDDTAGGFGSEAININPYFSSPESIGQERFVTWYGGHLYQSGGESGGANTCAEFGPLLRRVEGAAPPQSSGLLVGNPIK